MAMRSIVQTFAIAAAALFAAACSGETGGAGGASASVTPHLKDVVLGDANAPVTVVEYAALTCHVCRDFAKQVFPRLKSTYIDTGKVKYIYRDFPLEYDPATGKASDGFGVLLLSVARCKGADKFHEAVDAMFTAQADLLDAARTGEAGPVIARVADSLGLIELPGLTFVGEIRPTGRRDFTLEAQLTARAVQPCSVTLAPVPCQLEEVVRRRFDADFTAPETEEAEMVDDEVDPMPEIIDIAAIAAEALALALPLYPRAKGAELGEAVFAAPGTQPLAAADLKPFAGLAALADRLKKPDSDPSSQG